ncbi:Structural maintenance of chromosomes protein 6 [Phytophthora nicotianae]|uniref:non-specific serine/threonine protein kinase n=1 Tax=Phytophthora nicotianae TaxID=4792 RepID=A0A0W8DF37_PHYNI|nr:Structural maintenance of chromosomes protein 6 [Phytophthora nicotianae]
MPLCAACCVTKGFNKCEHLATPRIRAPGDKKTASLADFQLLSVIGQGAFGKVKPGVKRLVYGRLIVLLVRHSTTGKVHAMKIISKQFVIDMDSVHYMKTERDVMTKVVIEDGFICRLI